MSDDVSVSFKEACNEFRKYIQHYVVSLSFRTVQRNTPDRWVYGTGFLIELDGKQFIATAGHWVDDVTAGLASGALTKIDVRLRHPSGDLASTEVDPRIFSDGFSSRAPHLDAALIPLDLAFVEMIREAGAKFLNDGDVLRGLGQEKHIAMLCGYPYKLNVVSKTPSLYVYQGSELWRSHVCRLEGLGLLTTVLSGSGSDDLFLPEDFDLTSEKLSFRPYEGSLCSNPELKVDSAAGMSGGPVLAFRASGPQADFFKPYLIGLQSKESFIEWNERREITRLTVVGAAAFAEWAKSVVGKSGA